ncbi:hypothetical protein KUTeg_014528, partial [Tegillarca granosa]
MAEFAVMRWTNDGNRLSIHNLKWVIEPKDVSLKVGTEGKARYCGYPGLWQFRILRIGEKKMMQQWLDENINSLMEDTTDSLYREDMQDTSPDMSPEKSPKKRPRSPEKSPKRPRSPEKRLRSPEKSPKKRQRSSEKSPKKRPRSPEKSPKKKLRSPEKSPKKKLRSPEKSPKKRLRTPEKSPKRLRTPKKSPKKRLRSPEKSPKKRQRSNDSNSEDTSPEKRPRTPDKSKSGKSFHQMYLSRSVSLPCSPVSNTDESTQKRLLRLEEETSRLRKKNKKLEERIIVLEKITNSEARSEKNEKITEIGAPKDAEKISENTKTKDKAAEISNSTVKETEQSVEKGTDITIEELEQSIKNVNGDNNRLKYLCSKLFTDEELINRSRTGKKTAKSGENVKPALNAEKFELLQMMDL